MNPQPSPVVIAFPHQRRVNQQYLQALANALLSIRDDILAHVPCVTGDAAELFTEVAAAADRMAKNVERFAQQRGKV